jgi:threonine/homoserine/homoserine lactone efflux protein
METHKIRSRCWLSPYRRASRSAGRASTRVELLACLDCTPVGYARILTAEPCPSPPRANILPIELWFAFVAASAVLLVIPGPTVLTIISYSIAHGRRANCPLVAAVALGDSTALIVSLLGLGTLLAASAFWFTIVKGIGGLYLLYLGVKLLRAGISSNAPATPAVPGSRWKLFANTYLVTALNPKGIVFFVAFLPQFVNPRANAARQLWVLAATFVVLAILNATLYTAFAASARKLL